MASKVLTGLEKTAILLMCLGEQATARVFNELTDTQVQQITGAMASIDHIPATLKNRVLQQYRDAQQQVTGDFFKGSEFARNSITATNAGDRTEALLHRHISETEKRPFAMISEIKPQIVAALLEKEHPQIIALIVSTQTPEHGAALVGCLPESMQSDIVYRIARLENVSEEVLNNLENSLNREIGRTVTLEQKEINGFSRAVDLLNSLNAARQNAILDSLDEADDTLADRIRKHMFSFENLRDLEDRSLQMILREISSESLGIALQECSDDLKTRIFSNMSPRAVAMVREDIESMGEIRASEVKAMQQSIVKTAIRLETEGAFAGSQE